MSYLSVLVDGLKAEGGQLWFVKETSLGEQHACVVRREIVFEEIDTVLLQGGNCILLG